MIESDPLDRGRVQRRLHINRKSRVEALRANALERARLELELHELDEAIAGVDAMDMKALREWSERLDAQDKTPTAREQDRALEQSFPASDPPAHTAPGSTAR